MSEHNSVDKFDIDSHERICEVINLAMKGAEKGDHVMLCNAFHEKARMYGEVHGGRYDTPIKVFFALCNNFQLGKDLSLRKGKSYRYHIISVTRVGGAAMVMVAEDGCWGSAAFVDFFTVTLNEGKWQITNKTFAYTGGVIPEKVLAWEPPPELLDHV
jgi:hypothetical protein